jgi:hypothetical protein
MSVVNAHPPADRRCQLYSGSGLGGQNLLRCINEGTHYERWNGCACSDPDDEMCIEDFLTWECDGPHDPGNEVA